LRFICVAAAGASCAMATPPAALASGLINSGGAAYTAPAPVSAPAPHRLAVAVTAPVSLAPASVSAPAVIPTPPASAPTIESPAPIGPQGPTVGPGGELPTGTTGGQAYGTLTPVIPQVMIPGAVAKILPNGTAAAPADAPPAVQRAIFAANQIVGRPYEYGGGHGAFIASGYDCSGTISYSLHGANLLDTPMDSSEFMGWGVRGPGQWITIYTNPGHVFMTIAGVRLDTSTAGDPSRLAGVRWRPLLRSHLHFRIRSLPGL